MKRISSNPLRARNNSQTCWKGLGAEFLTEPKVHEVETRCYMRDPDGHLIEVGEAKK